MFQSTPLREGRLARMRYKVPGVKFQSTPLREGRQDGDIGVTGAAVSFNPRPCVRGDPMANAGEYPLVFVSIHAPA